MTGKERKKALISLWKEVKDFGDATIEQMDDEDLPFSFRHSLDTGGFEIIIDIEEGMEQYNNRNLKDLVI